MHKVIFLILAKEDQSLTSGFRGLVGLSGFSRHPDVKDALGAAVVGGVNHTGAHLTLTWTYPTRDVTGTYRCDVYGVDRFGHPVTDNAEAQVKEKQLDITMLLSRLQELDSVQSLVGQLQRQLA